jgi:hypothetical protein
MSTHIRSILSIDVFEINTRYDYLWDIRVFNSRYEYLFDICVFNSR